MFGWELPPSISGGLGTACQGMIAGLSELGVELRFVLPRASGEERVPGGEVIDAGSLPLPGGVEVVPVVSALQPYRGELAPQRALGSGASSGTQRLRGGYGGDLAGEVARYAAVGRTLGEARDFELVHAHDWMTFPAARAAAEVAGRPWIAHVHSCEYDRAGEQADRAIVAVEQEAFDTADRILCVSGYTARVLREAYRIDPKKLVVVHNAHLPRRAAGCRRERPAQQRRGGEVLFLGRFTRQKAPGRFLDAAARIARREPQARFVMAGDGELRATLERRALELGLEGRVRFPGFLAGPAVERAFEEAAVLVMPSISEPFGLVALEAMESGVPVVLTRQSGVAETVRSALKVDSEDVETLADRVLAVLRHPALADQLAREGRGEVARLTWVRQARRLCAVYRSLLGEARTLQESTP